MANEKNGDKSSDEKKPREGADNDVPAGFDVRVGRERGDGWLQKTPGQVIIGRLLGHYTMKGQMNDDGSYRSFYQVRLGAGCSFVDGGKSVPGAKAVFQDEDKEKFDVILTEGQILNVDAHKALEDLSPYTRDGGVYDVWFKYIAEEPVKGGRRNQTYWRLKGPVLKTLRPPKHAPRPMSTAPRGERNNDVGEDDIPF